MRSPGGLLERERELGALARLVRDVRGGEGACVLIDGAAGMGKTSLLIGARDLAREAGIRVLSARASELERDVPFGIAGHLLEPALAALPPAGRAKLLDAAGPFAARLLAGGDGSVWTGTDSSHAAVRALSRVVIGLSETKPTVTLVDDLQWCDAASLRWLSHLSLLVESLPILLLATTRPEGEFPDLMTEVTISPAPLTSDGIRALVAHGLHVDDVDAEFLRACCSATGGNPLYLRELVAALQAEAVLPTARAAGRVEAIGPAGVSRTVLVRLGRMSASAVAVAKAAAVLGDEAEPATIAALCETAPELTRATIDRLVRAGIFESRLPVCFVHPILRAAIYRDIGPARRAELHRGAAKALSGAGAAPDLVAAHLLGSDPCGDDETVELLRHTASVAMARGAPEHAVTYLRRALAEPPRPTIAALVLAELGAAEACGVDVDVTTAIDHLRAALAALDDPAARAITARTLAMLLMAADRGRDAVGVLTRAIDDAETDEGASVVPLLADLGVVAMADRDGLAQAREYLAGLDQTLMGQSSPAGRLAGGLASAGAVTFGGDARAAVALAREALRDGRLLAEETADSLAFYLPVLALLWGEDPASAARVLSDAVEDGRRRGSSRAVAVAMTLRAATRLRTGDLAGAQEDAEAALELVDELRLDLGTWIAGGTLIETLVARGELDRASALAERFSLRATESVWSAWLAYALASLALARDDPAGAVAHATECQLVLRGWSLERWPPIPWRGLLACALARVGTAEGRMRAEELSAEELANARRFGAGRLIGIALLRRAEVVQRTDPAQIPELLSEAETTLAACGARLELAKTQVALGREARRQGNVTVARQWLRTGLAGARACGATSLAAIAHDELAATGLRQRRMLSGGVDALTVSERRVAELAARGLTNHEIAQTLFLATRTVETHLAHTYQKLAIGGRRELAARLGPAVPAQR